MEDPTVCAGCNHQLEERPAQYHWRGRSFPGLVCPCCNALWAVGEGHSLFMEAVKASSADLKPSV
jgi:hypothetical protein